MFGKKDSAADDDGERLKAIEQHRRAARSGDDAQIAEAMKNLADLGMVEQDGDGLWRPAGT